MYFFLVFLVAVQRVAELQISESNEAQLRRRGAVEHGAGHYPLMVALHSFWLVACLVEWWNGTPDMPWEVVGAAWILFIAGQVLRVLTIRTLKRRWTTRVLVLQGAELVQDGPFLSLIHI